MYKKKVIFDLCQNFLSYIIFYYPICFFMFKNLPAGVGVMANVLDCDVIVSEFKLWLSFYIPIWTNTLMKCINFIINPALELSRTTTVVTSRDTNVIRSGGDFEF